MAACALCTLYSAIFGGDVSHASVLGPVWVTGLAGPWATTVNTWPRPPSLIHRALHFGAVYKGAHCPRLCSLSQVHLAATMAFVFGNPLPPWPGGQLTCKRLVQERTKNALWARDRPRPDPERAGPPAPGFEELGGCWPACGSPGLLPDRGHPDPDTSRGHCMKQTWVQRATPAPEPYHETPPPTGLPCHSK